MCLEDRNLNKRKAISDWKKKTKKEERRKKLRYQQCISLCLAEFPFFTLYWILIFLFLLISSSLPSSSQGLTTEQTNQNQKKRIQSKKIQIIVQNTRTPTTTTNTSHFPIIFPFPQLNYHTFPYHYSFTWAVISISHFSLFFRPAYNHPRI